jgi:hypothetical protein
MRVLLTATGLAPRRIVARGPGRPSSARAVRGEPGPALGSVTAGETRADRRTDRLCVRARHRSSKGASRLSLITCGPPPPVASPGWAKAHEAASRPGLHRGDDRTLATEASGSRVDRLCGPRHPHRLSTRGRSWRRHRSQGAGASPGAWLAGAGALGADRDGTNRSSPRIRAMSL